MALAVGMQTAFLIDRQDARFHIATIVFLTGLLVNRIGKIGQHRHLNKL